MDKPGRNRPVLVTGASKGLGEEIALKLAAEGFHVWAGVRDPENAPIAGASTPGITTITLDVTSDESVAAAIRRIEDAEGTLYGLVNNAGITRRCCFEDFPESKIREIFEVNTFGAMRVSRRALPLIRRHGEGRIVMISSVGGRIGSISVAPYVASKFALEGFAESLALELKFFNIGVTIVEPGIVKTTIWDENRILPEARNRESVYYKLFWSAEALAEKLLGSSTLMPSDVAAAVARTMVSKKPRLREVVGARAGFVLGMRRHLWGEWFEKIYFGGQQRLIRRRLDASE